LRALGCGLDNVDVVEGFEVVNVSMRSGIPQICTVQDFYPGIFPKKEEQTLVDGVKSLEPGLKHNHKSRMPLGDNIQTAEQYELLAKMGLVVDKRKGANCG
jgi:hypothetical protein